jgi:fucose permease
MEDTLIKSRERMIFVRDTLTWQTYVLLGIYGYVQAGLGPVMPFLGKELHLNYTQQSLHLSLFALGMLLAGLCGDYVARYGGHRLTFNGGAIGMALGAICFSLSQQPFFTFASAFIMGCLGSFLLVDIQTVLSDHHGEHRTIALTEANIVASGGAGLAPLLLGALVLVGVNWRGIFALPIVLIVVLLFGLRRITFPEIRRGETARQRSSQQRLPLVFWLYWGIIVLSVSVEFCMSFWGAQFLASVVGLPRATASVVMGLFFFMAVIARLIGSRLVRFLPADRLLLLFLAVVLLGFPFFWLGPTILLHILGLCVTGIGVANLFPLTLSAAIHQASASADIASARCTFAAGLAVFGAPLALGWMADVVGLQPAYGIVPVLIVIVGAIAFLARRWTISEHF